MKILEIIGGLNRGGAETLLVNILEHVKDYNNSYELLVYEDKEYDYSSKVKELGANIVYIESPNKIGFIPFIKKLKIFIKDNKYDVVHAHTLFNCGPVMLSAFLAGVKVRISHSHNTKILEENPSLKKRVYFSLSRFLINIFSTDCLACGEEAGKFLYYKYKNFKVIRNGIDIKKYKYNENYEKKLREKYSLDKNTLIYGNIGRLNFQKNQTYLIDIFNKINNINKNSILFIVGDGELKEDLANKIKKLNLENKIVFTGNIENANEYYSLFDCFLFPSKFEGLPFTLIEAQANGLPILASDQISDEVNISNSICFLPIEENDVDKWAKKSIELAKKHENNNYEESIVKNGYSINDTVNVLEKIYMKGGK